MVFGQEHLRGRKQRDAPPDPSAVIIIAMKFAPDLLLIF
jgi:hypothetical protein